MFTIKLYGEKSSKIRIMSADSFTILRMPDGVAEITLHFNAPDTHDYREDVGPGVEDPTYTGPNRWDVAIIENSAGKTTEIVRYWEREPVQTAA